MNKEQILVALNNAKTSKEQLLQFADANSVYSEMFNANKLAINSGATDSISKIGKAESGYKKAVSEANTALSELRKLDSSLEDSKYGNFLKTSIKISNDNIGNLRKAQGLINQANKLLNSLQSKNKL